MLANQRIHDLKILRSAYPMEFSKRILCSVIWNMNEEVTIINTDGLFAGTCFTCILIWERRLDSGPGGLGMNIHDLCPKCRKELAEVIEKAIIPRSMHAYNLRDDSGSIGCCTHCKRFQRFEHYEMKITLMRTCISIHILAPVPSCMQCMIRIGGWMKSNCEDELFIYGELQITKPLRIL